MAMYVLDQDRGRRRRAIARDRARRFAVGSHDAVSAAARHVANRLRAARARAHRFLHREGVPDDLLLIERVRARLGRVVAHPHAIQVGANHGRVTLSGPVLASEVVPLLRAVRAVRGVADIDDQLLAYEHSGSIPSLQGGKVRQTDPWTPALRAGALAGGALLALYGLRRRGVSGIALAGLGLGLALCGASHVPAERFARLARGRRA
jgi:hypothetical protein